MNSPSLMRDERGLLGVAWLTLPILIAGVLGLLGISAVAAIEWKFILALFALGIVGISFIAVLFFKAEPKFIMLATFVSVGIIVLIEVSFPMLVGGIMVIVAMWNLKMLAKKPLMLVALVACGLMVMVLGANFVLYPMGVFP